MPSRQPSDIAGDAVDLPISAVKVPDVEQMLKTQHQRKRQASMRTVLNTQQQ